MGEDLFRRGRKSRLAEGKVLLIMVNQIALKSICKPLVAHHTTANVPRNKRLEFVFFLLLKSSEL